MLQQFVLLCFSSSSTLKEPKRSRCNPYPPAILRSFQSFTRGGSRREGGLAKERNAIFTLAPRNRDVGVSLRKVSTDRASHSSLALRILVERGSCARGV